MRAPAVLLVLLLILPVLPVSEAQTTRTLDWEYRVSIPDPASGSVHVEMTFRNLKGIVDRMTLLTLDRRDPVANMTGGPRTLLESEAGGVSFAVDDDAESLSFDVRVERAAFKAGETLAHAGTDFALFKAEAFALSFTYRYFEGKPFEWRSTIILEPPTGWQAEGPWKPKGGGAYTLPAGDVLPRGFVIFGPFAHTETHDVAGKQLRYVRLGKVGPFEADLVDYISDATPYYESVYGPGSGDQLLVISTGDPMFKGGLGASQSLYVHETADLRTLAHEYAHVYQLFGTEETQGSSAIWFNEGDADLHSALSLFATKRWSPKQVNDFFDEGARDKTNPTYRDTLLTDVTYGTTAERFAYHKGTAVLRALDKEISDATGGAVGIEDLLRRVNKEHLAADPPKLVSNGEIRDLATALAGRDMSDFFNRYVASAMWPEAPTFIPTGAIQFESLVLEPPRAAPGGPITARLNVVNRGTEAITDTVKLTVDGDIKGEKTVSLSVGQRAELTFGFVAPAAGPHDVRVSYLNVTFHSLTAPAIEISRTSFVPASVRAGETTKLLVFLENKGELPGTASIDVNLVTGRVGGTGELILDGGEIESTAIPFKFPNAGPVTLTVVLTTPQGTTQRAIEVLVLTADADGDGVPDDEDAYPFNPSLTAGSAVNDARDKIPMPAWIALVALALMAFALRRRK